MKASDDKAWTIAYRNPRANKFHRVTDWAGTWRQAYDMAASFGGEHPELQIYYVTSAAYEAAQRVNLPERVARYEISAELMATYLEDHGNILVDSGRRVRMTETGTINYKGAK